MDSKDARCMQDDENDFGEERDMSSNQKKSVIKKMTVSWNGISCNAKGTGVELRTRNERSGAQADRLKSYYITFWINVQKIIQNYKKCTLQNNIFVNKKPNFFD